MGILRKILIGLCVILVLLSALLAYLTKQHNDFKNRNETFIWTFLTELSRAWNVEDVREKLTDEFLAQSETPGGKSALARFGGFGRLKNVGEIEVMGYVWGSNGKQGTLRFRASFESADTLVVLTLKETGGKTQVHQLHISPIGEIGKKKEIPV